MPRRLLSALVLAGACSAPSAPAPVAEARDTDAPGCVSPAPETLGVPYQRPGDPRQQVDALTVWGWSRDGRTLAVETFDAGPGAATCEGAARLFVVEADSGTLVPGGYTEVRHEHPDPAPAPCDPPDLQQALAAQREAILARHGVEVGHLLAPAEPVPIPASAPAESKAYAILLPTGRTATATLEVLDGDRERAFEARGSGLKLGLSVPGEAPLQLEPGARRRPYVWNYDLDRGLVFTSPDGSHMAIVIATTEISFEGDRTSWIAIAFRIPPGW